MSRLVPQDADRQLKPARFPPGDAQAKDHLLEQYNRYFFSQSADTPDLIARAQEIRYQVYCIKQQGYEDAAQHPDGREKDEFDTRSIHSLLVHRPSGVAMGTVRLVLPDRDEPEKSFAIQRVFAPLVITNGGFFPIP